MIPSPRVQSELKHDSTGVANMLCNQITFLVVIICSAYSKGCHTAAIYT